MIDDVSDIVIKEDFYEPANGEIFDLLKDHIGANRKATPDTILADMTQDADIGGIRASDYLRALVHEGVFRDQAKEVALTIRDLAQRRRLIEVAQNTIREAHAAPVSIQAATIRDRFVESVDALFPSMADHGVRAIAEFGDSALERSVEAHRRGRGWGIEWPIKAAEELIGALLPGRSYSLAGAAGSGKSALAQQLMESVSMPDALGGQKWCLWVQAEMEGEEVAIRAIAGDTGLKGMAIERGLTSDAEHERAFASNDRRRNSSLMVWSHPYPSVRKIRAVAGRAKRKGRLDLIVIDHLMYLEPPEPRMSEIEAIPPNMRDCKGLAKELGVPVLILMPLKSSYSDAIIRGIVRRPNMGDVNHPGAIDANSDGVLFVHRPEYILRRNEPPKADEKAHSQWLDQLAEWTGRAELIKQKLRNDDSGSWSRKIWFGDGQRAIFYDNDPGYQAARTAKATFAPAVGQPELLPNL